MHRLTGSMRCRSQPSIHGPDLRRPTRVLGLSHRALLFWVNLAVDILRAMSASRTRSSSRAAPSPKDDLTSARMRSQRRRDTEPELAIRSILHRRGLRFRVDAVILPSVRRRADIVLPRSKVAVLIHGCFWHGCPTHGTVPKSNATWWAEKLQRNRLRDADTVRQLDEAGWLPLVVWEHEDPEASADRIQQAVKDRCSEPTG